MRAVLGKRGDKAQSLVRLTGLQCLIDLGERSRHTCRLRKRMRGKQERKQTKDELACGRASS
jgi:hypothetical protein